MSRQAVSNCAFLYECNKCNLCINLLQEYGRITRVKRVVGEVELRFVCPICYEKNDVFISIENNKILSDFVYQEGVNDVDN